MRHANLKTITGFLLGALLFVPAIGAQENAPTNAQAPQIGSINFVDGEVSIDGQAVGSKDIGSAVLQPGEVLNTGNGRVEMLLTPGAFVRLDKNSAVELVSPSENQAEIGLDRGRVAVEVADSGNSGVVRVTLNGVTTDISSKGLYEFDAEHGQLFVMAGAARINSNGRQVELNAGNELAFSDASMRGRPFDANALHDDFYNWNSSRSSTLAQANQDVAPAYVNNGNSATSDDDSYAQPPAPAYGAAPAYSYGPGWYGPGWYWDPYYATYTWVPGAGLYYSPFGFGFYSPFVIYRTPLFYRSHFFVRGYSPYYRGYRGGFRGDYRYGNRYDRGHTFGVAPHGSVVPRSGYAPRGNFAPHGNFGGSARGGFSGGSHGGSMHGGGGFHGGGGHGHGH
jgi:uncharacterized membrane protein YgcG